MIINLTQHNATPEQVIAGVVDIPEEDQWKLRNLLTVDDLPNNDNLVNRAESLASLAYHTARVLGSLKPYVVMIGGAPFLMAPLEKALLKAGIEPVYAFSKRESIETYQKDGSVKKTQVFNHLGFVRVKD